MESRQPVKDTINYQTLRTESCTLTVWNSKAITSIVHCQQIYCTSCICHNSIGITHYMTETERVNDAYIHYWKLLAGVLNFNFHMFQLFSVPSLTRLKSSCALIWNQRWKLLCNLEQNVSGSFNMTCVRLCCQHRLIVNNTVGGCWAEFLTRWF